VIARLFPHPGLTLLLTAVWMLIAAKMTLGNLLLGLVLGTFIPIVTSAYWPDRPRLRNPRMILEYVVVVIWDIIVANVVVALIVLFKPNRDIKSHWITVPLELTSPEAITVLAGTITLTPGTVSAMLCADGRSILVHCLHADDPDAVRADIKSRYERRLLEIFQ
jgi:multicomponent K+:H+ antiporter subunit E